MNFIVYNPDTGQILRTGSCPEDHVKSQCLLGEAVVIGEANPMTQYIKDESIVDYTEEELLDKSGGRKAAIARSERDRLIASTDYIILSDSPVSDLEKWVSYRKALRDITKQVGFPEKIVCPEKPE